MQVMVARKICFHNTTSGLCLMGWVEIMFIWNLSWNTHCQLMV